MITVSIIGIVAAIALPSYQDFIGRTRIKTTVESIQNGLQKARSEALRRNTSVRFELNTDSSWEVGCVTPVVGGDLDCPAIIESHPSTDASDKISIVSDDTYEMTFTNFGTRSQTANGFNQITVDMTGLTNSDLKITVGAGGSVRVCNDNFAAPDPRGC